MPRRSSSLTSSATSVASSSASSDGRDSYKSPLSALPAVPDLRFEQSYISTIRGFLHETDKEQAQQEKSEELDEKRSSGQRDDAEGEVEVGDESSSAAPQKPHHLQRTRASDGEREIWIGALRVEWVPLLYVTIRDQVLSPLVQGAVWGIGSILLGKFSAFPQ
ncbi:uncharacterized protein PSFLO_00383 [Pseudozyma flocculosa]|uniref:Uncharacterized protein n=1 Tax=Pseudozyma flocculosa TaxID=84751 RepID=A0A5C3ES63_9BASI|nr:uncharacterized protein PSFLO_00383 [Pseudozyma flocculosa]